MLGVLSASSITKTEIFFIEYFYYEKFDNLIEQNEGEKYFRRSLLFLRVRTTAFPCQAGMCHQHIHGIIAELLRMIVLRSSQSR